MTTLRPDDRLTASLRHWDTQPETLPPRKEVTLDCGWGKLIFAQTFADDLRLIEALRREQPGQRDIAFYVRNPHVLTALAPHEVFLDPSHTYRLDLKAPSWPDPAEGIQVRPILPVLDSDAVRCIYKQNGMIAPSARFLASLPEHPCLRMQVAVDAADGQPLGVVMGVNHQQAFDDPERGGSLWALAVDPRATRPGIGAALTADLARSLAEQGAQYMDLSVLHNNTGAMALYEKMGFERVPVFTLKNRNALNEPLYSSHCLKTDIAALNPYAHVIVREALRRGIRVSDVDAESGYFRLSFGGRSVRCRESLSELTSAVAMSRCADKWVTRQVCARAGLNVPAGECWQNAEQAAAFLRRHAPIVVKPIDGEQGQGITLNVTGESELEAAVTHARRYGSQVLLEAMMRGQDLRVIVINDRMVAAAIRKPPEIQGDGVHTIAELIQKLSRRREQATGGESRIPLDGVTLDTLRKAGYRSEDILPYGTRLRVRDTANLHTGGTIHDVTERLHPALRAAAETAAQALEIPVTGIDLIVRSPDEEDYVIIEANERPGLANHEPQPTAERFIDLLFPQTADRSES